MLKKCSPRYTLTQNPGGGGGKTALPPLADAHVYKAGDRKTTYKLIRTPEVKTNELKNWRKRANEKNCNSRCSFDLMFSESGIIVCLLFCSPFTTHHSLKTIICDNFADLSAAVMLVTRRSVNNKAQHSTDVTQPDDATSRS